MRITLLVLFLSFGMVSASSAQALWSPETGPTIEDFGQTYPIDSLDFEPPNTNYRLIFDVAASPDDPGALNPSINTVARFINMHVRAGVPLDSLDLAIVLHGSAGKHSLSDPAYVEKYETGNANVDLLSALSDAGVEIYICGQTAVHRGFRFDSMHPDVKVALSAMTVLAAYQMKGFNIVAM